jgi:hypothetical protein
MTKPAFLLFSLMILCFSCKTAYVPNTVNVPLFDDAGQIRLSGDLAGNVQFAASLGNSFAIMANGMFKKEGEETDLVYGKGSFGEIGIGGFSRSRTNLKYEAFVGAGVGKTYTKDNGKTFEATGARFFFQPSLGYHHSIFELAFTPRLVAGKFQKPTTSYTIQELISNNLADVNKPVWMFLEPAVTARVGYKWLKLQLQLGRSIKLNDQALSYKKEFTSLGVIFDLGRQY